MKKIFPFIACLLIILTTVDTLDAQRRRSRRTTTETEEKSSFADKINYEIRLGNIGFGNGFAIDLKPSLGYKINKYVTVGGFFRLDYDFINNIGFQSEDFSLFSYGPGLLARGKFIKGFYLQGEYTIFNFDNFDTTIKKNFPSVGVGMIQGGDNWKYNLEIMLITDNFARDYFGNTVEFWFSFSKNF